MRTTIKDTRILSSIEKKLHVHIRSVDEGVEKPLVVFSHGFITDGTENHRMFIRVSREFNMAGYSTLLFDHYGCGYSDGEFIDFRLSIAAADIASVSMFGLNNSYNNGKVILFGQSLGTASCVLASKHIGNKLANLLLWNLSDNIPERYTKIFGLERNEGGKYCIGHKGFVMSDEFFVDASKFDIVDELSTIQVPIFLLTCTGDLIADPGIARKVEQMNRLNVKHVIFENANHSFLCQPNFEEKAAKDTLLWLTENLV